MGCDELPEIYCDGCEKSDCIHYKVALCRDCIEILKQIISEYKKRKNK